MKKSVDYVREHMNQQKTVHFTPLSNINHYFGIYVARLIKAHIMLNINAVSIIHGTRAMRRAGDVLYRVVSETNNVFNIEIKVSGYTAINIAIPMYQLAMAEEANSLYLTHCDKYSI